MPNPLGEEHIDAKDMSTRAYIATATMQGLLAGTVGKAISVAWTPGEFDKVMQSIPATAVRLTDELLKELRK